MSVFENNRDYLVIQKLISNGVIMNWSEFLITADLKTEFNNLPFLMI